MLIPLVHPLRSALLLTPLLGLGQPAMAEEESRVQQRANAVVS